MNQPASRSTTIRFGPAGWSYRDWEGIVYPPHGSKFDHLAYLADRFDTIEVNSSFYRIPPPAHGKSWVRRTAANEGFRFTVKLFREFTHEKFPGTKEESQFREFLDTLHAAKKLGAVLVQFPWSFRNDESALSRIDRIAEAFREYPLAVEVRHSTFQNPAFVRFLDERNITFVNIDQPLFNDSVKPSSFASGPVAYVRFHGRNYRKWFEHEEAWERYDYLYTPEELEPWAERIGKLAEEQDVYVITNNHFRGQAIVNAIDLQHMMGLPVRVPPAMAELMKERLER